MTSLSWFAAGLGIGLLLTALIGWSGRNLLRAMQESRDEWKRLAHAESHQRKYWQRQATRRHALDILPPPESVRRPPELTQGFAQIRRARRQV